MCLAIPCGENQIAIDSSRIHAANSNATNQPTVSPNSCRTNLHRAQLGFGSLGERPVADDRDEWVGANAAPGDQAGDRVPGRLAASPVGRPTTARGRGAMKSSSASRSAISTGSARMNTRLITTGPRNMSWPAAGTAVKRGRSKSPKVSARRRVNSWPGCRPAPTASRCRSVRAELISATRISSSPPA